MIPAIPPSTPLRPLKQANTVCILGDSITRMNTAANSSNVDTYNKGYFTWLNILSSHKYLLLNNGGVDGERSDQWLARLGSAVLAYRPTICIVAGPINDIIQGVSATVIKGYLTTLYQTLLNAGITPVALTITPMDSVYTTTTITAAMLATKFEVNDWIRKARFNFPGLITADVARAMINPTDTSGYASANLLYDGLHPTILGGYTMGLAIKNAIDAYFPAVDTGICSLADNYGGSNTSKQLIDQGLFQGSGGTSGTGASGTVATGWTLAAFAGSPTVVGSVNAWADGIGNSQDMVVTSGANNDAVRLRLTGLAARFSLGDWASGACDIEVTSPTKLRSVHLVCETQTTNGGALNGRDGIYPLSETTSFKDLPAFSGRLKTPPVQYPVSGGATVVGALSLYMYFNGSGGATVKCSRAELRKGATALLV